MNIDKITVYLRKNWLNLALKCLVAGLLGWALYRQVFSKENIGEMWTMLLRRFEFPNMLWLLVALVLAPLNLAFEALKYRALIKNFSGISFWKTYRSVLAGTTVAIFTPNRVGEYVGRVLFVEKENGWKSVIATMVGGLSQLLVLLALGLPAAVFFSWQFLSPKPFVLPLVGTLGALLVGLLVFAYFNIDLLIPLAKRIPRIEKLKKHLRNLAVLRHYTSRELAGTLGFALLRYLTYSTQYFLLLKFFGIPVSMGTGYVGIASIYLVQASIPLPPVTGLLARSEIALFVWGFFSQDTVAILAASFSLFVINLVVPALLGLWCIVQINVLKNLGYEVKIRS